MLRPMADEQMTQTQKDTGRVLLVDDEITILELYSEVLRAEGHQVETAPNAAAALGLLEKQTFDAIVSDLDMPGMNGIALLRKIRELDPDVPVTLFTGGPTLESAMEAAELGVVKYLVKPVAVKEMRETVTYAIQMSRLARAKREALTYATEVTRQADERAESPWSQPPKASDTPQP